MASSSPVKLDDQPDIAGKIMRRADAAKKARLLIDRLSLAKFKTEHGWEHLSLDVLEPKVEQHLRQKASSRPSSASGLPNDVFSDTSSSISDHPFPASMVCSSPLGAPIFSDDAPLPTFGRSSRSHRKRSLAPSSFSHQPSKKSRSMSSTAAAQAAASLRPNTHSSQQTQSSPVRRSRRHSRWPPSTQSGSSLSFVSESTSLHIDEDDGSSSPSSTSTDLPVHSFQESRTVIASSPPRTPPPSRRNTTAARDLSSPVLHRNSGKHGEEGADLLLYLATSPLPATPRRGPIGLQTPQLSNDGHPPNPKTPGSAFNYYDFVNVTPSPSQPEFFRTPIIPGSVRTPGARRRLNFDNLAPPLGGASPSLNSGDGRKGTGLGMELGGELVS